MDDGHWKITFRFNGRTCGKAELIGTTERNPHEKVDELQRDAVRREGSIFVTGWTVEWVEPELQE